MWEYFIPDERVRIKILTIFIGSILSLWLIAFIYNYSQRGEFPPVNNSTLVIAPGGIFDLFEHGRLTSQVRSGNFRAWEEVSWFGVHRKWVVLSPSGDINIDCRWYVAYRGSTSYTAQWYSSF